MSFFDELKRRNVFRVGIAYAVSTWVLLQIVDLVLENISAPEWVMQVFMLAMAIGFPVALIFAWAFEMTPDGIKREHEVDRTKSITSHTGRKLDFMIIGVMALALIYFTYDKFVASSESVPALSEITPVVVEEPETIESDIPVEADKSIAVLPFVNMSSDPEQEYFADGISEELLNALAKVSDLKVAGRTSSFSFKGKDEDLQTIGKILHVSHILEGSVRKSGNRLRITAQLIKVDDGFHLWSETYDREITDIFTIQDEIAAAIMVQLKTQLLGEQQLTKQTDPKVYELYLLAKQRIYERTQPSLEMATKLLEEAISIDPGYSPAFAQLGIASILISDRHYGSLPFKQADVKAEKNLKKALQLDPQDAEALAGMGLYLRRHKLDHTNSLAHLRQAVAINPNLTDANAWLANGLDNAGEIQASLQLREITFERDPLHSPTFGNLQQSYSVVGEHEKAMSMTDSLYAYLPDDANLISHTAQVSYMTGHFASAIELFQKSYEKEPLNVVANIWYGFSLWNAGQYQKMADIAPPALATMALSRLGRKEEAFIMGKKAVSEGAPPGFYFRVLIENNRHAELINMVESLWTDLDGLEANWPGGAGYGYNLMGFTAEAYRELGDMSSYDDAMSRFKVKLDKQRLEGANNFANSFSNAYFALLSGDVEGAIDWVEKGFQQGGYIDTVTSIENSQFKQLDGDPRYEAAKAAMMERWNLEREKMGLQKVGADVL